MNTKNNREELIKILDLINNEEKGLEIAQIVADLSSIFSQPSIRKQTIHHAQNDEEMEII